MSVQDDYPTEEHIAEEVDRLATEVERSADEVLAGLKPVVLAERVLEEVKAQSEHPRVTVSTQHLTGEVIDIADIHGLGATDLWKRARDRLYEP